MAIDWTDDALVVGTRKHGENDVLLELLTQTRGRCLGLVRGGRSSKQQATLQIGNRVRARWRARLDEHLGVFTVEMVKSRAGQAIMNPLALFGMLSVTALARLSAEREPHTALFEALDVCTERLAQGIEPGLSVVLFELCVLSELGFGLDLERCAATGQAHDLIYVSPNTGRAVSKDAGAPYAPKLLPLPAFLGDISTNVSQVPMDDILTAFRLTGFFLQEHVLRVRGLNMPDDRARFLQRLKGASSLSTQQDAIHG